MANVTDPNGVKWSVDRAWWVFDPAAGGGGGDGLGEFVLAILLMILLWPLSLIAHGLGLPWTIVIERDGRRVGKEKVRGWNKSGQRIQEIAQSAAAGTWPPVDDSDNRLFTEVTAPPRTELYLYNFSVSWDGQPIAQLELTDWTMRCTIKGKRGYARWLSKRLEIPDLKKRLKDGQQVTVFEFPRYGCHITWPEWNPRGAGLQVRQGDAPVWTLSFVNPDRAPTESEYKKIAGTCQQWREALGPTGLTPA
jgi:hypothetical protein